MSRPAPSLRALLRGVIDYAGLFPPASRSMVDATAIFAAHLASAEAWMLGRFVVPLDALGELAAEADRYAGAQVDPWRVSALLGPTDDASAATIRSFNETHLGRLVVDTVEWRGLSAGAVADAVRQMPAGVTSYVELPASTDIDQRLSEIGAAAASAKLRTGGVTVDAYPAASDVAHFIARCAARGVAFKATAGLHHPVCGEHPLTYAVDAPRGRMFGFLNIFAASVFAHLGAPEHAIVDIVSEDDPSAFEFGEHAVQWRSERASVEQVAASRELLGRAFGSCSIDEPVNDLRELGLL